MADDVIDINVAARGSRATKFRIAGTVYTFTVPKMYRLLDTVKHIQSSGGEANIAMFDKVEAWLFDAMDPAEAEELRDRLMDDDDDVDIQHLIEVFQELTKAASSRPSGERRSGS